MCLSKPQKVLKFDGKQALVQFQDSKRVVASQIPLKAGDFVVCQGGIAVQKISAGKAREMLKEWEELNSW